MTNLILPRRRKLLTSTFAAGLAAASPAMGHNGGPVFTDADVAQVVEQNRHVALPWGDLPVDPTLAMFAMAQFSQVRAVSSGGATVLKPQDVFSINLFSGLGSTNIVVNNGLDMASGSLLWQKWRGGTDDHYLWSPSQGTNVLQSNTTAAYQDLSTSAPLFSSTGFTDRVGWGNGNTIASWSFKEAPNFFDVVTWTGNGSSNRAIPHALGVKPAVIIIKRTSSSGYNWVTFNQSVVSPNANWWRNYMYLDQSTAANDWGSNNGLAQDADTSNFYVGSDAYVNASGATYVAYMFAHDASANGIVQCGLINDPGSNVTVTLGWRPQYLLIKVANNPSNWYIYDTARGISGGSDYDLRADTTAPEGPTYNLLTLTSTGFTYISGQISVSGNTIAYVAIREAY